jgi:hypothetical protein
MVPRSGRACVGAQSCDGRALFGGAVCCGGVAGDGGACADPAVEQAAMKQVARSMVFICIR